MAERNHLSEANQVLRRGDAGRQDIATEPSKLDNRQTDAGDASATAAISGVQ